MCHRAWYLTPRGRARLESDKKLLAPKYACLEFFPDDEFVSIYGNISVAIGTRHGIVRTAPVLIVLPRNYPQAGPWAFIDPETFKVHSGKTLSDRHFGADGNCCLEIVSSWNADEPNALLRWVENFVLFIHRQFIYDGNGGVWPGPEWKHGLSGRIQFVEESLSPNLIGAFACSILTEPPRRKSPCPCGSGKPYAACHKRQVNELVSKLPSAKRKDVAVALQRRYSAA
jgi:hypothetical protein